MNKNIIKNILKLGPKIFTSKEIRRMMDDELSKSPEEMDTELVDICVSILSEEQKKITGKKGVSLKRAILVAAAVLLLISIAVPVSAKYMNNDVSDKIVEFYSDYFKVNLRNGKTDAENYSDENIDLLNELKSEGFDNIILPKELLESNFSKEIKYFAGDGFTKAVINFDDINSNIEGHIVIDRYNEDYDFGSGQGNVPTDFEELKQLSINGLDIIAFSNNGKTFITYIDNNTEYFISLLNCDFEKTIEIANTLK